MRLAIIRHGHAVDREDWSGDDLHRPLTKPGMSRAQKAFARYYTTAPLPSIILSSEAVRALQTAEILGSVVKTAVTVHPELNPGASPATIRALIDSCEPGREIAIVGHEPDLSSFISEYAAGGSLSVVMKKGSICRLEDGVLVHLVQQKTLRG